MRHTARQGCRAAQPGKISSSPSTRSRTPCNLASLGDVSLGFLLTPHHSYSSVCLLCKRRGACSLYVKHICCIFFFPPNYTTFFQFLCPALPHIAYLTSPGLLWLLRTSHVLHPWDFSGNEPVPSLLIPLSVTSPAEAGSTSTLKSEKKKKKGKT